jgi:hypothetical protein
VLSTADLIYQEAKTLPESLGAEVLDFIGDLRTRHCVMPAPGDKVVKLAELEEFFAPYQRNLSDFQFNRNEANERWVSLIPTLFCMA